MGVLVNETIDLPGYRLEVLPASAFSIAAGETFLGRLEPDPRADADSFWFNFDQEGQYRVTLERTSEGSLSQFGLEIMDRQVASSRVPTDDVLEVILNIGGETRRPAMVVGLDRFETIDYRISLEFLGPLPPGTSLDAPHDPTRPVSETTHVETRDLPPGRNTLVLQPGETLVGTLPPGDYDRIAFQVEAGVAYTYWFTGTGVNPIYNAFAYPVGMRFGYFTEGKAGAHHFVSSVTGTVAVVVTGTPAYLEGPGDYSFTLTESVHLDEVRDAPNDVTTPYRMGPDGRFTGTIADDDRDWIGVRLVKGHAYEIDIGMGDFKFFQPLVRSRQGKPLTWEWPGEGATIGHNDSVAYIARYTGLHFIEPQGIGGEYELLLTDFGTLGLTETIDARFGTSYVIQIGETFDGTLQDYDRDNMRLSFDRDGWYSLSLQLDTQLSYYDVDLKLYRKGQANEFLSVNAADGSQLHFYAYAGQSISVGLANQEAGSLNYELSLTQVSDLELDEAIDAPGKPHDLLNPVEADETFTGYLEPLRHDLIPFEGEAGVIYKFVLSGSGTLQPMLAPKFWIQNSEGGYSGNYSQNDSWLLFGPSVSGRYFVDVYGDHGFYNLSYEIYDGQLSGTKKGENINGTWIDDIISGRGGDDLINGANGNDRIYGNHGDDTLGGSNGNDRIWGGIGKDRLYGAEGSDALRGGAGSDELYGENGDDRLFGGGGNDQLWAGAGDDIVFGGAGDDLISSGFGSNWLNGGAGRDTFFLESNSIFQVDTIDGLNVEEDKIIFDANFERTFAAEKIVRDAYALPAGHRAFFTPGNGEAIYWVFEEAGYLLKFTESHYVYLTNFKLTDNLVDVIGFY